MLDTLVNKFIYLINKCNISNLLHIKNNHSKQGRTILFLDNIIFPFYSVTFISFIYAGQPQYVL